MKTITVVQFNQIVYNAIQAYWRVILTTKNTAVRNDSYSKYQKIYQSFDKKVHKNSSDENPGNPYDQACDKVKQDKSAEHFNAKDYEEMQEFKNAFIKALEEKFEVADPVFTVINEINKRINELKSEWNPLKRDAQPQIIVLNALITRLLGEKQKDTIKEVITLWASHYKSTIEDWPELGSFITALKKNYGDEKLKSESSVSRPLKQKIYQYFVNYLESRRSWFQRLITFLFRNSELSAKKEAICEDLIDDIQNFKKDKNILRGLLNEEKAKHAQLSRDHHKNHYNLDGERRQPAPVEGEQKTSSKTISQPLCFSFFKRDVRKNEDRCRSDLADAFHDALNSLPKSI